MGEALKQQFDIKFIITICGFVALMGGFYYTTTLRLEKLEEEVKELNKTNNRLIVVEERLKSVQEKTDLIYEIVINLNSE
ncbi:MAG: hypothetical protein CMM02_11210 [Rhodopirellula sp.]|jgi:uncharacterized membrane protein YciS (DUF1049 family)|nr:hypothetical protein [Rhodopirellula sp.]